jgi:TetR/AcrR family transcriptional regulator, cholesterol catabolism regulator
LRYGWPMSAPSPPSRPALRARYDARRREVVATAAPPVEQLRGLVATWVSHVVEHRHHMLVFTQERQAIERQRRWRRVRSQRQAFEKILDEVLARGEADGSMTFADRRLSLLALLGMVNYTPQWVRPNGRLSSGEIAEGYCAMVLGGMPT